ERPRQVLLDRLGEPRDLVGRELRRGRERRQACPPEDLVRVGAADAGERALVAQQRVQLTPLAGQDAGKLAGGEPERVWTEVRELRLERGGGEEPDAGALPLARLREHELASVLEREPEHRRLRPLGPGSEVAQPPSAHQVHPQDELAVLGGEDEVLAAPLRAGEPPPLERGQRRVDRPQGRDVRRPGTRDRRPRDERVELARPRLHLRQLRHGRSVGAGLPSPVADGGCGDAPADGRGQTLAMAGPDGGRPGVPRGQTLAMAGPDGGRPGVPGGQTLAMPPRDRTTACARSPRRARSCASARRPGRRARAPVGTAPRASSRARRLPRTSCRRAAARPGRSARCAPSAASDRPPSRTSASAPRTRCGAPARPRRTWPRPSRAPSPTCAAPSPASAGACAASPPSCSSASDHLLREGRGTGSRRRRRPNARGARRRLAPLAERGGAWPRRYLTRLSILNIGRYIAITMMPTMMPTPIIISGSMIDVSAAIAASTSSS